MASKLPPNPILFAKEKDPLLNELIDKYAFHWYAARPSITIVRPPDEVLKKMIAEAKKDADYSDPEVLATIPHIMKYFFKEVVSKERIKPNHWYGTLGRRVFTVYTDGDKFYFHDDLVDDDKIKQGIVGKMVTLCGNNATIISIDKELGQGSAPKTDITARKGIHVYPRNQCGEYVIGGGNYVNRNDVFVEIKKKYNKGATEFMVGTLMDFLSKKNQKVYEAVNALMTGYSNVDAALLLEPMCDSTKFRKAVKENNYLVPDHLISAWANSYSEYEENWKYMYDKFLENLSENQGVDSSFADVRAQLSVKFGAVATDKLRANNLSGLNAEIDTALKELYSNMASNNVNGKAVFSKSVHGYLNAHFDRNLADYLQWRDLVVTAYESQMDNAETEDWLEYLEMAYPGQNFKSEIKRSKKAFAFSNGVHLGTLGVLRGITPYLRAAESDVKVRFFEGTRFMPSNFEMGSRLDAVNVRSKKTKKKAAKTKAKKKRAEQLTKASKSLL